MPGMCQKRSNGTGQGDEVVTLESEQWKKAQRHCLLLLRMSVQVPWYSGRQGADSRRAEICR